MRVLLGAALALALLGEKRDAARFAQQKFDLIESGRARPGTALLFSPAELNAWMRSEAKTFVPEGARELRLEMEEGRAIGYALIDFLKLKQAVGERPGYVMQHLLSGERPVSVRARLESRNGRAKVTVEHLEISGVPLQGAALDLLLQVYLRATFPDAHVGEWFALDKHVDHFSVHNDGVRVQLRR